MPEAHDPYAALRFADYRFLLSGSVLASMGAEVLAVAVSWELYDRTGSAALLGFAGLAQFLPVLLLSLPAGQAADRFSRKMLLQVAQVGMTVASLGLAVLSLAHGPISIIFLCLVLIGCSRAFSAPARWSLVPLVVPPSALGNAVTWNSSGWQIASASGPAIGGLLIGMTGQYAVAYCAAALGSLMCVVFLTSVNPQAAPPSQEGRSLPSLLAGVRFVWKTELLLAAITLDLFAVLLGGATALLPIFAKDLLIIGPVGLGYLRAAPALGALVMALAMAHWPPFRRPGWALVLAVAGFGAATIAFGLSRDPILSFVLLAVTGALDNISVVVRGTLVQVLTPDAMRGRVAAVNLVFISSSNELGAFESGVTAHWFGPIASVVGGGIGTMLVVLAVMAGWPRLLQLGPLQRPVTVAVPEDSEEMAGEAESPRLP